jgi:CheY-like chemotaxis protein
VRQHESETVLLQERSQVDVYQVPRHSNTCREYVQERGRGADKSGEASDPGKLQHEHGTIGQHRLPLDQHIDIDRRQERRLGEHERHGEPVAAQCSYVRLTNRVRSLQFGGDDLVEQSIRNTDARLPFTPHDIREAGTLLLSDEVEYGGAIHASHRTAVLYGVLNSINTLPVALRKVILIVEDDEELRRMFRTSLLLEGFEVIEAGDGLAALTRIDREPPDLVVLDLMLPSLSGVAVRQEIAGHALTRNIPIVIVTGSAMNVDHLDVACVLRKPIAPETLVDAVKRCFQRGAPGVHS